MKLACANCANAGPDRQLTKNDMKKPNVRGPSPARKAHLALREKIKSQIKAGSNVAYSEPRRETPAPH
ncbi:MAG TPA: hypothetical protein VN827_08000 [Chthoniobacterales bacterium]|jgi:hypothetical protein|nr:hypothetical protein [Chthoniobacterales bacterium]